MELNMDFVRQMNEKIKELRKDKTDVMQNETVFTYDKIHKIEGCYIQTGMVTGTVTGIIKQASGEDENSETVYYMIKLEDGRTVKRKREDLNKSFTNAIFKKYKNNDTEINKFLNLLPKNVSNEIYDICIRNYKCSEMEIILETALNSAIQCEESERPIDAIDYESIQILAEEMEDYFDECETEEDKEYSTMMWLKKLYMDKE